MYKFAPLIVKKGETINDEVLNKVILIFLQKQSLK